MIILSKTMPDDKLIRITYKCNKDRIGNVMTKEELHQFGTDLLIAYLPMQNGKFVDLSDNISKVYLHLVVKNPDDVFINLRAF
jgi:hypothetical protein